MDYGGRDMDWEGGYGLGKEGYGLRKKGYGLGKEGYGLGKAGYGLGKRKDMDLERGLCKLGKEEHWLVNGTRRENLRKSAE